MKMISGIQIALKNAIDVVSDNPDKFRRFVVASLPDQRDCVPRSLFVRPKRKEKEKKEKKNTQVFIRRA